MQIIECVPNISEGRDISKIDDIVSAIKSTKVLNVHTDPDHNRTVITFMDEPQAVLAAAYEMTKAAVEALDIREHEGEHPFIGIVDVVPFVPIKNISVEETVKLACEFGKDVAAKPACRQAGLALPVYFYGEINHKELPKVRKGGYEPDLGKGRHLTAGAMAIGVRDYLIAFNINLATSDIDIARSIAKNIRETSGGLPGVRAIGINLKSRNIAQVSINVTDHRTTSLKAVFDEVDKWAKEYDAKIIESELVGMIPKEACFDGMAEYLKLQGFSSKLILENHQ